MFAILKVKKQACVITDFIKKTLIPLVKTFGEHFKKTKVVDVKPQDKQVHRQLSKISNIHKIQNKT